MMECMKSMAKKSQDEPVEMENERMKVSHLDIIVTMIDKKPYYEIKYKEIGSNHYSVGYSSYKLENVLSWRDECFEVVEKPQTNADRIRSMTDEELAEMLSTVSQHCVVYLSDKINCRHSNCDTGCKNNIKKWLQKEMEKKDGR
jgi:hypothetical protein|nr:MAG TPA: hypothetical protein [Caudoviricetes sp.]